MVAYISVGVKSSKKRSERDFKNADDVPYAMYMIHIMNIYFWVRINSIIKKAEMSMAKNRIKRNFFDWKNDLKAITIGATIIVGAKSIIERQQASKFSNLKTEWMYEIDQKLEKVIKTICSGIKIRTSFQKKEDVRIFLNDSDTN